MIGKNTEQVSFLQWCLGVKTLMSGHFNDSDSKLCQEILWKGSYCGNLRNEFFEKIWYDSPQMLEVRSTPPSRLPTCSRCSLAEYCRTCPGLAYIEEGDFRVPSKTVCQEARIIRDAKRG